MLLYWIFTLYSNRWLCYSPTITCCIFLLFRACWIMHIQSHQPDQNTHQMYKTGKSNWQFIVPCGNATIIFDLLEKTFHPAALFILPPVHIPWFGCIRFWRNTVSCSGFSDFYSKVCCSIRFVRHDNGSGYIHMLQKLICHRDVTDLTTGKLNMQWIAQPVCDCMNFCISAATYHSDMFCKPGIRAPFSAPALCWCALQQELSILTSCMSASSERILNMDSNTPVCSHLAKHLYMVFQFP